MPIERPKALYWVGKTRRDGRPEAQFPGVPARDLTERDIARLSDEQLADVMGSSLYQKTRPAAERSARSDQASKPVEKAAEKPAEKPVERKQ